MKVIETVVPQTEEQKQTPMIWGAKYKVIKEGFYGDISVGETVILIENDPDSDGDFRLYSEDDYDLFKPEHLELIEDGAKEETEIIVGNKYTVTGNSKYGNEIDGKVVTVSEVWHSGELVVKCIDKSFSSSLVKPHQLTPYVEPKETKHVVEMTDNELIMIKKIIGQTEPFERRTMIMPEETWGFDAGALGTSLYDELGELLGDKYITHR